METPDSQTITPRSQSHAMMRSSSCEVRVIPLVMYAASPKLRPAPRGMNGSGRSANSPASDGLYANKLVVVGCTFDQLAIEVGFKDGSRNNIIIARSQESGVRSQESGVRGLRTVKCKMQN